MPDYLCTVVTGRKVFLFLAGAILLGAASTAQPLVTTLPQQQKAPNVSAYYGSYVIAKADQPPAFRDFREFVIDSIATNVVRGRVVLRDGAELRFTSGSLHAGRLQFTTVRSPQGGVSYSFQGDMLSFPPNPDSKIPVLEGTLKLHRHGAARAAGKLPFAFRPIAQ